MMVCFVPFAEFMHGLSVIFPEAWDEFMSEGDDINSHGLVTSAWNILP